MPSLRKRVSSYLRQLSFHNEAREKRHNVNENTFVTKYLQGYITLKEGPPVIYGKNPTDLPNYELGHYETGPNSVVGCYTGPNGGLTTVKRIDKHLSVLDPDIDFIDTQDDNERTSPKKYHNKNSSMGRPIDNTTMIIKVAGHEYCVTNKAKRRHSKSHSLGSIGDFNIEIEKTKIDKSFYYNNNTKENISENRHGNVENDVNTRNGDTSTRITKETCQRVTLPQEGVCNRPKHGNYSLAKSKSEGNPFQHKKRGRVIKVDRPNLKVSQEQENANCPVIEVDDSALPADWNRKCDKVYGISDSLYDRNQVTSTKNGDPIADCFGIIARTDSAIIAVADGVNWGEKASVAAKSAVHGSLHYLNKTIFNDTKLFENLTVKTEASVASSLIEDGGNLISNTREVFVCLLRAFNCAHDLILENEGMLTTLTVAVVLPLKQKLQKRILNSTGQERIEYETQYVCCACNVGDTLAYVYSQKYGIREITKGSHDVSSARDMRDALGALGPVDGINPELSNLTLSVTTLHRGDIVLVASDGLTDNFDPNVCKYTVNTAPITVTGSVNPITTTGGQRPKPKRNHPPLKGGGSFLPLVPSATTTCVVEQRNSLANQQNSTSVGSTTVTMQNPTCIGTPQKPPVKPVRKSKTRQLTRNSEERSSVKSTNSDKSLSSSTESQSTQSKVSSLRREYEVADAIPEHELPSTEPTDPSVDYGNPLIAQFVKQNSVEKPYKLSTELLSTETGQRFVETRSTSVCKQQTVFTQQREKPSQAQSIHQQQRQVSRGYKLGRSKTSVDMRPSQAGSKPILRNDDGVPYVTPMQRYELQLLLIEDILTHGISGKEPSCTSAKKLCENLVSYTMSITSAKRHTLEDKDLYFDGRNGMLIEVSNQEKKLRRKRGLEKVQTLPGKLDHVTVVAYNVGMHAIHSGY